MEARKGKERELSFSRHLKTDDRWEGKGLGSS
jgi:hypothetical protein